MSEVPARSWASSQFFKAVEKVKALSPAKSDSQYEAETGLSSRELFRRQFKLEQEHREALEDVEKGFAKMKGRCHG